MRIAKTVSSIVIAGSLVSAPVLAQAATGVEGTRLGVATEGEDLHGLGPVPIIVGLALLIGLIVWQISDDEDPQSP
jgi:hypothetical protein